MNLDFSQNHQNFIKSAIFTKFSRFVLSLSPWSQLTLKKLIEFRQTPWKKVNFHPVLPTSTLSLNM